MLCEGVQQISEIRGMQKPLVQLSLLSCESELRTYQELIEWMLQFCISLELQLSTGYLARKYLDLILDHQTPIGNPDAYLKLAIACVSIALKFNETRWVSEQYPPRTLFESMDLCLNEFQICQISLKILTILDFQLRMTTPFDYYPILLDYWPELGKLKMGLDFMLQYGMTLKECSFYTAQQFFYGGVLAVISYKKVRVSQAKLYNLRSLHSNWLRIENISMIILRQMENQEKQQSNNN